jgi:hypothetical protein
MQTNSSPPQDGPKKREIAEIFSARQYDPAAAIHWEMPWGIDTGQFPGHQVCYDGKRFKALKLRGGTLKT